MAFQSTITRSPARGVEGMIANSRHIEVSSKVAKTTLAPGRAVRVISTDNEDLVSVPTAAAEVTGDATRAPCMGVTHWDGTALNNPYLAKDPVGVIKEGCVWVISEAIVNPSLPVYIRHTADGALNVIGGFSSAAGTGLSLAPPGFRWMTTTTAVTSLAVLELNLP